MTIISDLSPNYLQEIAAPEMLAVVGGCSYYRFSYSYKKAKAKVNIVQVAIGGYCCSLAGNYSDVFISQN